MDEVITLLAHCNIFKFEPSGTWNKLWGSYQRRQIRGQLLHRYFLQRSKPKWLAHIVTATYSNLSPVAHEMSSVQLSKVSKLTEDSCMDISFLLPSYAVSYKPTVRTMHCNGKLHTNKNTDFIQSIFNLPFSPLIDSYSFKTPFL